MNPSAIRQQCAELTSRTRQALRRRIPCTRSDSIGRLGQELLLRFAQKEGTFYYAECQFSIILAHVLLLLSMGELCEAANSRAGGAELSLGTASKLRDPYAFNCPTRDDGDTTVSHFAQILERTEGLGNFPLFMKIQYIDPFIKSVFDTLSTKVQSKIERGGMTLPGQARDSHTVVAPIGVNGLTQHSGSTPKKGESST